MAAAPQRPAPFPPGTRLSEHYLVEGLVRLAEGRMYYLANDDRSDRAKRYCWECGNDETPRSDSACVSCGASLAPRRFLIAVHWHPEGFDSYARFFEKHFEHPGILAPIDMFFQDGVLCSVTPWTGERLLLDEGSPLPLERVIAMGLRATGVLAYLQHSGVHLGMVSRANFLVNAEGQLVLYDPEVAEVYSESIPDQLRAHEITQLGEILRRYTPINTPDLQDFFLAAEEGAYPTPMAFGRALEELADSATNGPLPTIGSMSDVGLCRNLNEDNWSWANLNNSVNIYVVADGMGGHDAGEVASEMAVETICREARARLADADTVTPERLENVLEESFQRSNNGIKAHSEQIGNDMGTTMVAAIVADNRLAYVANVGDSRGYLIREQVLHQITRDHSLVARMVEQNRITREEARNHPHANILLRTVGTERDVEIDIFSVELEVGDRLLMCSDGLWGEVEDEDIEAICNHYEDPRIACRELVRAAHHGGGRDNITVMLVDVPPRD